MKKDKKYGYFVKKDEKIMLFLKKNMEKFGAY